ncbi:MAG: hypothetical protein RLZZ383_1367 [Pseudomonadota bacterium]
MSDPQAPVPARSPLWLIVRLLAGAGVAVSAAWWVPGLEDYRPWAPGDGVPVLRRLLPGGGAASVVEDARTGLVTASAVGGEAGEGTFEPVAVLTPEEAAAIVAEATATGNAEPGSDAAKAEEAATLARVGGALAADAARAARQPSSYGMGFVQPIEDAGHRGLSAWYRALGAAPSRVVRALHFGDSTIAADGIARTVRARLQARFGAGGPGFVSAAMDPRWNKRYDVTVRRGGTWDTTSLLEGGAAGNRYGLGGTVAIGDPGANVAIDALDGAGKPVALRHVELWYQGGASTGAVSAKTSEGPLGGRPEGAASRTDLFWEATLNGGASRLTYSVSGGPVPFYGVVLEAGAGVTWEALGITAVGSGAYGRQDAGHLRDQLTHRRPDLIVMMLGGNDAGLRGLASGDPTAYKAYYLAGLQRIRGPLPEASCLLVTPLDQGVRRSGKVQTKPAIPTIVEAQRQLAAEQGCAFWSAFDAMGGNGSFQEWMGHKPPLAWTDLMHLSTAGQEIIGNLLADALLADYEAFSGVQR